MDIRLEHKKILFQIDQSQEDLAKDKANLHNNNTYWSSSSGENSGGVNSGAEWLINTTLMFLTIPLGIYIGGMLTYLTATYWWSCIFN